MQTILQPQSSPKTRENFLPASSMIDYRASGKLEGKVALIAGGDKIESRLIALAFAKEGADVAFIYSDNEAHAQKAAETIDREGHNYLKIKGNIGNKKFCEKAVKQTIMRFGKIDILVNNTAHPYEDEDDSTTANLDMNVYSTIFMTQAAIMSLKKGAAIINLFGTNGEDMSSEPNSLEDCMITFTRYLTEGIAGSKGVRVGAVDVAKPLEIIPHCVYLANPEAFSDV